MTSLLNLDLPAGDRATAAHDPQGLDRPKFARWDPRAHSANWIPFPNDARRVKSLPSNAECCDSLPPVSSQWHPQIRQRCTQRNERGVITTQGSGTQETVV